MIERREEYSSFIKSLPNDIIMDILSRLPVKSLVRFECVSKSWLALLTDPYFAKMHLNRSYDRNNNKQFVISRFFQGRATILVFSGEIVDSMWPSGKGDYPPLDFACRRGKLLGCCDGLLLYSTSPYTSTTEKLLYLMKRLHLPIPFQCESDGSYGLGYDPLTDDHKVLHIPYYGGKKFIPTPTEKQLHLVNPSTRKVKRLPPPIPFQCESDGSYGIGYDALTDDYKVVHVPNYVGKTCITTLYTRKTNSWRRIQDIPYRVTSSAPAALLNGALHWLTEDMSKIVSLNLGDEKFQVFILPEFGTRRGVAYLVTVVGGCLCVCVSTRGEWLLSSEFWVMKEYGKRESWTNLGFVIPNYHVKPLDFSNNHNLLYLVDHSLRVSNVETNTRDFVKICDDFPHQEFRCQGLFTDFTVDDAENFLESIVSPAVISHHT